MPKVNGKKFSYTPKGMKAAKKYAKKTGSTMSRSKPSTLSGRKMTNKNMSRRKPGSGGSRVMSARPKRMTSGMRSRKMSGAKKRGY